MKPLDVLVLAILFIILVTIVPFAGIWSLNTLFALAIPYTVKTWAAMVILLSVFVKVNVKTK